jgi:hypothetical protein
MSAEVGGALERLYRQSRFQADDDLVFARPEDGGLLSTTANGRRVRKALAAARLDTTLTITASGTRSVRAWPRSAHRCGRCRNGWGTATSRPRSVTRTTRPATTKPTLVALAFARYTIEEEVAT